MTKIKEERKRTVKLKINKLEDANAWFNLSRALDLTKHQLYQTFDGGIFGSFEIEIDEDLNIIKGKIIPCGPKDRRVIHEHIQA